ncbi:hypothetical protein ACH4TE_16160 [Streptomyces sioyaensis]
MPDLWGRIRPGLLPAPRRQTAASAVRAVTEILHAVAVHLAVHAAP